MEAITKEQKRAIDRLNKALENAHKHDIFLAGMNCDLIYATQYAIDNTNNKADDLYCPVGMAMQFGDDGTGRLYSENYQDSGGW